MCLIGKTSQMFYNRMYIEKKSSCNSLFLLFYAFFYVGYYCGGVAWVEPCYLFVFAVPRYLLARIYACILLDFFYCKVQRPLTVEVFEYLFVTNGVERVVFF